MVEWQGGDLRIDGRKIHYYRTGARGKPPVVLLHGFTNNGLTWTPLVRDLGQDYDIVAFDAAGHGLSDGPGPDPAPDQLRDDVIAAIVVLEDPGWRDADAPPGPSGSVGTPEWQAVIRTLPTLSPEERRALALQTNP